MFKVNNKDTTLVQSGVFIVNFEHISYGRVAGKETAINKA